MPRLTRNQRLAPSPSWLTATLRRSIFLLAFCALSVPQAEATKFPKNKHARFRVAVEGVQTTKWSENHKSQGGRCDVDSSGSGSERIVFSSRPIVLEAWQIGGAGSVHFIRPDRKPATLRGRGHVTRRGTTQRGQVDPSCAVGDGGGDSQPPASDCGRKRITKLPLTLAYDTAKRKRITLSNDASESGPRFDHCPFQGEGWTSILRWDDKHGRAGEELPPADLFDKRQGKILVIGKGVVRRTAFDATSTTRIEWTLTLTRLRR